ncbi:MAG: guanylate kinase [Cyanobacteriota bacterium]
MSEPQKRGNVVVITGPSGVGKGTIVKQILAKFNDIVLSVSATTRKIRPGERNGVEYYFKSVEEFKNLIDEGQMLEWAIFADNYYGTFKDAVKEKINEGKDVILEIEVQGAMQVKDKLPESILIFIAPPSLEELKTRLVGRATETPEVVMKRLKIAEEELKTTNKFKYVVKNDNLELAIKEVENIILNEREN